MLNIGANWTAVQDHRRIFEGHEAGDDGLAGFLHVLDREQGIFHENLVQSLLFQIG